MQHEQKDVVPASDNCFGNDNDATPGETVVEHLAVYDRSGIC